MKHATEDEQLQELLGYRFRRPELLQRALTHRSMQGQNQDEDRSGLLEGGVAHNERLEFLGDAVLDLLASEHLYDLFPDWSEGQLSRSRARVVNAQALEIAARRLGLGAHLRLGRGEERTGGRDKATLLADAFEAVLGAIYLDGGLQPTREFLRRALLQDALVERGERLAQSDFKSALQEFLQAKGRAPAEYHLAGESGPDHRKEFEVEVWVDGARLAYARGNTKKEAEQRAADRALELLASPETHG